MSRNSTASYKSPISASNLDSQLTMSVLSIGKDTTKAKQIVVRFDQQSYNKISAQAKAEHRGLGEFVRHAALDYIEHIDRVRPMACEEGGSR